MIVKIISGGQSGVDRAALDAALAFSLPCGGWCPAERMAEDGTIPTYYPLVELPAAGYEQRTEQNVIDSDGSVIIYFTVLFGGTEQDLLFCQKKQRPYLLIDADKINSQLAAARIGQFAAQRSLTILNVAGPRASHEARACAYTLQTMKGFLKALL